MKAILVATVGTRELAFQVSSGTWYNIGDDQLRYDQLKSGETTTDQAKVIADLGLPSEEYAAYRELTYYFYKNVDKYRHRLQPVIIGKLLLEKADEIDRIHLIATDQGPEVEERKKDTLYSAALIQDWVTQQYLLKHNKKFNINIIHLGQDGINPSNFEQMFRWWRQIWRDTIKVKPNQPLWVCLKGGVGQASEASRISGLSFYGDRIQFFEFRQNRRDNEAGIPSSYTGPFLGTNYLWDRSQQQALRLLKRYDYAEASELLESYFELGSSGFGALPQLLKAGIAWNQGEFDRFFAFAKTSLTLEKQKQRTFWWWMAYEQAKLGVIRLEQQSTSEAMLHSFRAIEGLLWAWALSHFRSDIEERTDRYPMLLNSICRKYSALAPCFVDNRSRQPVEKLNLTGWIQQRLLEAAIPSAKTSQDFLVFWETAKIQRNVLSHRLGGVTEQEVFEAWGEDVTNQQQWETRILNCLNLVTGQKFESLGKASLFTQIHEQVVNEIAIYQP